MKVDELQAKIVDKLIEKIRVEVTAAVDKQVSSFQVEDNMIEGQKCVIFDHRRWQGVAKMTDNFVIVEFNSNFARCCLMLHRGCQMSSFVLLEWRFDALLERRIL